MDFSTFDARHYETLSVPDGYRIWSRFYDRTVRGELDLELLERIRSVDWTTVRAAADLACGTGRIGAWLLARGVGAVDGVDLTPEMLAQAAGRGGYRALARGRMDRTPLRSSAYDLVTNVLAVEHLEDVAGLYREGARLTRPGGHFLMLGYHPHFLLNGIPTHFDDETGRPVAVQNFVHLFSDHVSAALTSGWALAELHERVVEDAWVEREPGWRKHRGRPVSFLLVWRRNEAPARD